MNERDWLILKAVYEKKHYKNSTKFISQPLVRISSILEIRAFLFWWTRFIMMIHRAAKSNLVYA